MKKMNYSGEQTKEISFPLGGIGTGCIGLAGDGRLIDWEIFNRPNKKSHNFFSFFAAKAECDGKLIDARAMLCDPQFTFTGYEMDSNKTYNGYGFGPNRVTLGGVPHFPTADFISSFPMAEINYEYEKFPAKIHFTAFNPFIPANDADSSIPAGMFEYEIENTTDKTVAYTLCGVLNNPLPDTKNTFGFDEKSNVNYIRLGTRNQALPKSKNGELCIATDAKDVSFQEYWFRGSWFDNLQTFWNDFTLNTAFKNRSYQTGATNDSCSLAVHLKIASGEKKKVHFVLSWHFPTFLNFWNPIPKAEGETEEQFEEKNSWKNYYTRYFSDSVDCSRYCLAQWDRMEKETNLFREALFSSTLPPEVIDAVSGNLAILKSPTCLRNYDGSFYGFEGCMEQVGSCEGSCTHVWNYAYALPFLFPSLERSMRVNDYKYNQDIYGSMCFRIPMPLGRAPDHYFPCADGQFGGVLKVYRDFKICGDVEWLIELWPSVRKAIEFAWSEFNPYKWDLNHDGVLEGRQHHTLDVELFGPSSWLCGMYLAALKAGSELALIVRDKKRHAEYTELFKKGKAWVDKNLFNGRYYFQKIDVTDKTLLQGYYLEEQNNNDEELFQKYWNEETGEIKYQIGEGSSVDQVLAQWHANLIGLGEIFDKKQVLSALKTIYEVNFKKSMRDFFNPCRLYALNEEAGVTICTYPEGAKKPAIPVPYAEECMNGFEYQAACHMIQEGMVDEGLEIVRAIRARYDGTKRNPFAEMECGSDYARSMASYALINAICGFEYDMYQKSIGFAPLMRFADQSGTFKCFFALEGGYGTVEEGPDYLQIKMLHGEIKVKNVKCPKTPLRVYYAGRVREFEKEDNTALLGNELPLNTEKDIMIIL